MVLIIRRGAAAMFLLATFFGGVFSKFFSFQFENPEALMNETILTADALAKGLKYFKDHPENLTTDAVLGVLIVRANLQWIFDALHRNSLFSDALENLLQQSNDIVNLNQAEDQFLLRKVAWDDAAKDLKWGNYNAESYKFSLPKFNSCESIDSYFMNGTPENSDFCINELVNAECDVSEGCWFSETNKMHHSGYKTSHRFLYFLIATQLNCEKKNAKKFHDIRTLKHKLCQRMFSEAEALFEEPHLAVTRDLFLEHAAFCGLEGYMEFAPYDWRKIVRNWQNPKGCFGYDTDFKHCQINPFQELDRESKTKRTDTVVDGCHTHVTAVALSSLAFFLRVTATATFNLL